MIQRISRPGLARRRFVQGLALGGVAAGLGFSGRSLFAQDATRQVMTGTQFDLVIGELPVNFTGRQRLATVANGRLPAPLLRWRQGEQITVRVRNCLAVPTSLHWHGILVPADMDGVPGLSYMGIPAGEAFTYRFTVNQSGTYWYHSHSRFQEQTGLFGPIVIEPRGGERHGAERDYVVLLSDWSDTGPEQLYATLKKQSDAYNFNKRTVVDYLREARARGILQATGDRAMWNRMRMDATDLTDISAAAYTYLMNGVTPGGNWSGLFARGEKVRLRIINGSAMTYFDVRIPGLSLTVVAADGQDIEPVSVDEFRIGVAETYDVIVAPSADRAWTILAQAMDGSGYARGTLTPHAGMVADVPAAGSRPVLTTADMMGDAHAMHDMPGMAPAGHATMQRTGNPGVDMRVATPRRNLDDPGAGLRNNGRRVLTYADLHGVDAPISLDVSRELRLHLTGNMERYMWSFDGTKFSAAEPVRLKQGERVRITLHNDTMMNHPIHLHGMWSELEDGNGSYQARKHTVNVQPAQQVSYRVNADAPGSWAFHCHMLYHMEAGMFREVVVV
jgi:CopA family copper-resistance protein